MWQQLITWLKHLSFLVKKEFLTIFSDPANRAILFVPALMQALLFGYAATYDVNHVDYAILDQSNGQVSHELISKLDGSGIFKRAATLEYTEQIKQVIDNRQALLIIAIPNDFESKLNNNQSSPIQIIVDGRNSSTAMVAGSYLNKIIGQFNQQKFNSALPISLETRTWYNPNQESRWSLMPALIAALSMMQTLLLSALSVAREREQGTFDQLLVTPYIPLQIMIGKALPPIFVGLMQSTIILLIILFWFKIPMNGSIGLLYFGLFSFNVAVVGVGLSISALSLNMQQAMLFTFLLIMPLMLLSGLLTPVENMPKALQVATYANPLRFGINLVQRVYLEGASFAQVKLNFLPMIVLGIVTLPLAAWLFRNRLS
ncbi:Inner membrane permease protein [Acinetobacter baumannii]|uniref:ABC transporter permease n=1 Tax=Acinetobacter baumannii TaxID=470 RepID=UPI000DE66BFF|nr:ABC transporter permease [Acinetobacter baumannii]MDC5056189.1 ABC transporter permease [Acinetobacter baumannii]MDV7431856.1 ABC transporter permease [Acinetobacter baumannii]SSR20454.1 Inner membrane permease protein [Acinetobacter baumannii]HCE0434800.1 ABC transporter permease [Acinetobacter baumannii]